LIQFRRPRLSLARPESGSSKPGTFNLLGFTHYWAKSRNGNWVVKLKTARDRLRTGLTRATRWCREHRHRPVSWQWRILSQKLRGHYEYFGITGNLVAIDRFREQVRTVWCKWLNRRSQRSRMPWKRMELLLERYPLPQPSIRRVFTVSA
jgi:RNA-directed DNA polymerase